MYVKVYLGPASAQPGENAFIRWTTSNQGVAAVAGSWTERVYISSDGTVTGATLLTTVTHSEPLAIGASVETSIGPTMPSINDGNYRIVVVTDALDDLFEGDGVAGEDNNETTSAPFAINIPAASGRGIKIP